MVPKFLFLRVQLRANIFLQMDVLVDIYVNVAKESVSLQEVINEYEMITSPPNEALVYKLLP